MSENNNKKVLAYRLTLARKQSGLTQEQVSKLLAVHRPTISEIEAGRRSVTSNELLKFSNIYGVSTEWLLSDGEKNFSPDKEKLEFAARELSKLKKDDLNKVINLLSSLRGDN